jgi:WD40 repeat protein
VAALAFRPQGGWLLTGGVDWLATGGSDGAVSVWDVVSRKEVVTLGGAATAVAWHPSGTRFATASLVHSVRLWDLDGPQVTAEVVGHEESITCLAYSPDGRWLASGSLDRTVRLWDSDGGAAAGGVELDSQVRALAFSPDGKSLFTSNGNSSCYQLDVGRLQK